MLGKKFADIYAGVLSADQIVTDPEELKVYGRDWTTRLPPNASLLLRPRDIKDLVQIMRLSSQHKIPVVPSGGRTGLAGGAVASQGEVVLSLERFRKIGKFSATAQTLRVGAGVSVQEVQEKARSEGLVYPIDLASKGSAQIGGTVNTNAGGLRVIRYGHTRNWVQSLEVVTAGGEVLELNGDLEKNNTGYDLRHLVIGSEGTLCVVTEATLKLCVAPPSRATIFLSVESISSALDILKVAREEKNPLSAFEILSRPSLESVLEHRGLSDPFGETAEYYVLLEFDLLTEASVEDFLANILESKLIKDGVLAESTEQIRRLWEYREGITESLAARGSVYKNDLALPVEALSAFAQEFMKLAPLWYASSKLFVFGHLGDGNLHVNVLKEGSFSREDFFKGCEEINEKLFALVQAHGGSIAAEHGIGLLKKRFLNYSRRPLEISLMRAIKQAWDPEGILNPGKIFDL